MEYIKRNKKRHFLDIKGKWAEVGRGFAKFEDKKNPETVERQYFHESDTCTRVVGYSPVIEYELDAVRNDAAAEVIRRITESELIGEAATVRVMSVDMSSPTSSGAYPAICRDYSVVAGEDGGDTVLNYKGKLKCASPAVRGTYVAQSGMFVEGVN